MSVTSAIRHEIDVESHTRCDRAIAALASAQRGVYAVGHLPLPPGGRWMAAVLAAGHRAVLSHRSAAELWGIRNGARSPIEVITLGPCRRPDIQAPASSTPC